MLKPASIEGQYRQFLLLLSGFIFIGTAVELWFTEHFENTMQLVPFFLCGIGFIAVAAAWYVPRKGVLQVFRVIMALILLGGLFGIYEHVAHNLAFELEIRPNATAGDVFWISLSGASPFLAPGILTLGAILALAAVYRHPCLNGLQDDRY